MKKYIKWGLIALILVVMIGFAGFYAWATSTYGPSEELKAKINLDEVLYEEALIMEPVLEAKNGVGIIIYPGEKVENAGSYY